MRSTFCVLMLLLSVPSLGTNAPQAVADSFELTAAAQDLGNYFPTYLANGYWSVASSPLGITPTLSLMAGFMDYTPTDVSRPAALPSWNEIDYYDGEQWIGAADPKSAAFADYAQTLDMR